MSELKWMIHCFLFTLFSRDGFQTLKVKVVCYYLLGVLRLDSWLDLLLDVWLNGWLSNIRNMTWYVMTVIVNFLIFVIFSMLTVMAISINTNTFSSLLLISLLLVSLLSSSLSLLLIYSYQHIFCRISKKLLSQIVLRTLYPHSFFDGYCLVFLQSSHNSFWVYSFKCTPEASVNVLNLG
jgi:hypothetical protein